MSAMLDDPAEVAAQFALLTGIDCTGLGMIDASGEKKDECSLCEAALRGHLPPKNADPVHRFAAYQAERLGGRYIYVCPYSLLHIASPIIVDEMLQAVLVSGPVILGGLEDETYQKLRLSKAGALISQSAAGSWLRSLPRFGPEEATACSDILARVALSCCDPAGTAYLREASPPEATRNNIRKYLDYLSTMEGEKRSSMTYPLHIEQALMDRVSAGDREEATYLLHHILDVVTRGTVQEVEEARSRVLEMVVLLSRAAIAGGAEVELVFGLEYRSLQRLRQLSSIDSIEAWLSRILSRFMDLVFDLRHVRYSAHLSRTLSYIREHFAEPITLEDAAAAAGLSSGYLRRILRSELNTSFTAHLRKTRLDAARRLLKNSSLPVGEVAVACGLPDHSYFTQLFRKELGLTPREYRLRPIKEPSRRLRKKAQ